MSIKEEFEKAFEEKYGTLRTNEWHFQRMSSLWAAKWMGERCAKVAEGSGHYCLSDTAKAIRTLAKELES
jgi:hypothetical protein